eukprot:gene31774-38405_t
MSSRQRRRFDSSRLKLEDLVKESGVEDEEVDVSEEDIQKPQFVAFSESESSEDENDQSSLVLSPAQASTVRTTPKKQNVVNRVDEDALLDSIIAQSKADAKLAQSINRSDFFSNLLQVDGASLDIDQAHRNRFQEQFLEAPNAARSRLSKQTRRSTRKFFFGQPKLDWPKPVAYINGGIQMIKSCENLEHRLSVFRFEHSEESYHTHKMYGIIHNYVQDPNTLLMFSIHFPHNVPALLAVSTLFFKSNMHERGVDNIRRGLHVFEHAFLEQFATSNFSGKMHPNSPVNQLFFDTVYQYLCICIRQQLWSVALQVLNLLLTINPTDDVKACLLHLDFVLLMNKQYNTVVKLCGLDDLLESGSFSLDENHWDKGYVIDVLVTSPGVSPSATPLVPLTLRDLPNWQYSLALAYFNASSCSTAVLDPAMTSASSSTTIALNILTQAIRAFPAVAYEIMQKLASRGEGEATVSPTVHMMRKMPYFSHSRDRIPATSYLHDVMDLYVHRAHLMWNSPPALSFLSQGIHQLAAEIEATKIYAKPPSVGALLAGFQERYGKGKAGTNKEDFEPPVFFPPDLPAIFHASLLDERLMNGQTRFAELQRLLEQQEVLLEAGGEGGLGEGLVGSRWGVGSIMGNHGRAKDSRWYVDFARPLLQIFLLTFLPWIHVPRYRR